MNNNQNSSYPAESASQTGVTIGKIRAKRTSKIGKHGEDLACKHFENLGYEIIHRNYHAYRRGEVDVIALKDNLLVFCEVRARKRIHTHFDIIDPKKIKRVCRAAVHFLWKQHEEGTDYYKHCMRFDFIHVIDGKIHQHLENAWEYMEKYDEEI